MPESSTTDKPIGVVAVVRRGADFLVIRRSRLVRAPGAYCFPGGGIHAGESESEALIREIREELGCDVRPQRRLWQSVTAWGVSLAWWETALREDAVTIPNPEEVESVHWLPPDRLRQLPGLLSSNLEFLDAWRAGRFQLGGSPGWNRPPGPWRTGD
jgi:8-oxo-dGTP pyrophosphatase MutT (NUDIX family)